MCVKRSLGLGGNRRHLDSVRLWKRAVLSVGEIGCLTRHELHPLVLCSVDGSHGSVVGCIPLVSVECLLLSGDCVWVSYIAFAR